MKKNRGFTLIELLVVIAIIGILSAVVLASLNTARTKGDDAGVKSNLDTVKTQAALYNTNNNSYGSFDNGSGAAATCPAPGASSSSLFGDATVQNAIAAALKDSGASGATSCMANAAAYAVSVSRADTTNSAYWCVDSTGISCGINSLTTGTACGTCASTD